MFNFFHKSFIIPFLFFFTLSCCIAFPAIASKNKPQKQKFALLIGIDEYEGRAIMPTQGAKNDIKLIQQVLIHRFHVHPDNIQTLINEDAHHLAIKRAFAELAENVNPGDMVYIHYSGPASYTRDLGGDDNLSHGKDTNWLSRLSEKTDHFVFVSDTSHTGSDTSSTALDMRETRKDARMHPLTTDRQTDSPVKGIRVYASRKDEKAAEFRAGDEVHGMFTWFWTQSLDEASPDQTWDDIYTKTCTKIRLLGEKQHPRILGSQEKLVFGGDFQKKTKRIDIRYVSYDGQKAKLRDGSLSGVTVGSIYRLYGHGQETDNPAILTITKVEPIRSEGRISGGKMNIGDQVELAFYQHDTEPLKVFVRESLKNGSRLTERIVTALGDLPAFELTEDQEESDFIIHIFRPQKDKTGHYTYISENDNLPAASDESPPECWVLTPNEQVYRSDLKIDLEDEELGIKLLSEKMVRIARIKNLATLVSTPDTESPLELEITIWNEAASPDEGSIEVEGKYWQKDRTVTSMEFEAYDLKVGQLLTFSVYNKSDRPYYIYLVDITPNGAVIPFYPTPFQDAEAAKLAPGYKRKIEEVTVVIDKPGQEYIRLIAALEPLEIQVLSQRGYALERSEGGLLNPLEELLSIKAGHIRATSSRPLTTAGWTTVQGMFDVHP